MTQIPRSEHPRPDFMRSTWLCLNGTWEFSFDQPVFDRTILVPFACEAPLSGIHDTAYHHTVWYRRSFRVPDALQQKRLLLHFGAVDYSCRLWVNGQFIRGHTGGQVGFFADITHAVSPEADNTILLEVTDDPSDLEMPRGKQYWKAESEGCFYTRTTGIWQSVWLEGVHDVRLVSCRITPMLDQHSVRFDYELSRSSKSLRLEAELSFHGAPLATLSIAPESHCGSITYGFDRNALSTFGTWEELLWSPERPNLFDVTFRVYDADVLTDTVQSYFGLRKITLRGAQVYLNDRPYYQRLLLDQGYWPQSLLTAPTDEALIQDIELTKAMGFNGVRKHQKVEDPRYLYHADRMGLLVWGEIGAGFVYSERYADRFYREWLDTLQRDYNHPCIVAWTPLNESWGVPEIATDAQQQAHSAALVQITKSMDTTRPVIDNDGWEHVGGDYLTIHDYEPCGELLRRKLESPEAVLAQRPVGKQLYVGGNTYQDQPMLLTEFGGIRLRMEDDAAAWGYCEATSQQSYEQKLEELFSAVRSCENIVGYCYTQLTDIEQEQNGLLTYDRKPKLPLERIRKIVLGES